MNGVLGLIIDAFGDLREQLDSVKSTLEVKRTFLWFDLLVYFSQNVSSVELDKIILTRNHMDLR